MDRDYFTIKPFIEAIEMYFLLKRMLLILIFGLAGLIARPESLFAEEKLDVFPLNIIEVTQQKNEFAGKKVAIYGFLLSFVAGTEKGKLYYNEELFSSLLPDEFSYFIYIDQPAWLLNRPDFFNNKEMVFEGLLEEFDCDTSKACLVLTNVTNVLPYEAYLEVSFPDIVSIPHHIFPVKDITEEVFPTKEFKDFLSTIRKGIHKNNIEIISNLFPPAMKSLAKQQLEKPGSFSKWLFFNDLTGLPTYYQEHPIKSSLQYLLKTEAEIKIFVESRSDFTSEDSQAIMFCVNETNGQSVLWPTDWLKMNAENVSCFPFLHSVEKFYLTEDYLGLQE